MYSAPNPSWFLTGARSLCAVIDAAEEGNEASFINTNDPAKVNAIFVPVSCFLLLHFTQQFCSKTDSLSWSYREQVVYNGRIHVLVVAVKSIEEDEEIFVDYGPFYREYRCVRKTVFLGVQS